MTKREYFDLLVRTSAAGLFPAVEESEESTGFVGCRYRTPDGRKCAGGLLIPDEDYDEVMEGRMIITVLERWDLKDHVPEGMTPEDLSFVQGAHDSRARLRTDWDHEEFVADLLRIRCFREFAGEGVVAG
jgi:hypothetical protein